MDRGRGFIEAPRADAAPERIPLMTLSIGLISAGQQQFSDIREISEAASEARRLDSPAGAKS